MPAKGGECKRTLERWRPTFGAWHAILAACHLATAVAVLIHAFVSDRRWRVPVDALYSQWETSLTQGGDDCGGDAGPCVVTVQRRRVGYLAVWVIVPFFSIASGLHHAAAAYSLRSRRAPAGAGWYAESVADGTVWVRWADYAVSATLMLLVNAALWVSPTDLQTLVLWAAAQTLIIAVGAGSEVAASAGKSRPARVLFWSGVGPFVGVWLAQLYVFYVAVDADDGSDPPAVVYLFLFGLLVGFSAFPIIHGFKLRALRAAGDDKTARLNANLRAEARYAGLSFSVKFPLLLAYWAGSVNRDAISTFEVPSATTTATSMISATTSGPEISDDADTNVYIAFGVGGAVAFALDAIMLCVFPPHPEDLQVRILARPDQAGSAHADVCESLL